MTADEARPDSLKSAVEHRYGVSVRLVRSETVADVFLGEEVWKGEVYVFALSGKRDVPFAYAWYRENIRGEGKVYLMLRGGNVWNAATAVKVSGDQEWGNY